MNWFQRHLNWTVVLAGAAGNGIGYAVGFSREAMHPGAPALAWASAWFIPLIIILPVAGWALKQKNRSLGWLGLFFAPFGWIAFLFLENRSPGTEAETQEPEPVEEPQSWGKSAKKVGIKNGSNVDSQMDDTLKPRQRLIDEAPQAKVLESPPVKKGGERGYEKPIERFCSRCGYELSDKMDYCPNCGEKWSL